MNAGILVHGYNLHNDNWEEVVWGKPPHQLGRVPRAVLMANQLRPAYVVFGSGASEKDGKKEAVYTIDYLLERFNQLTAFHAFQCLDAQRFLILNSSMKERSIPEVDSQRTHEEIRYSWPLFKERKVTSICLVSSPDHISRCLTEALKDLADPRHEDFFQDFRPLILGCASDVSYTSQGVRGVLVAEPAVGLDDLLGKVSMMAGWQSSAISCLRQAQKLPKDEKYR